MFAATCEFMCLKLPFFMASFLCFRDFPVKNYQIFHLLFQQLIFVLLKDPSDLPLTGNLYLFR